MQATRLTVTGQDDLLEGYDDDLAALDAAKDAWARIDVDERIRLLGETRDAIAAVAETWANRSAQEKGLQPDTPLAGEEWLAGPYAALAGTNALAETLTQLSGKTFLDGLPQRTLANGRLAIGVLPHTIWDRLLLSGVSAEVWMQDGVDAENLKNHAAVAYDIPMAERTGKVALVLGAGNIAAIPVLDVLQKLIIENQVVLLKMNPVNDYLTDLFQQALKPFIEADALRIVIGDARGGSYLCEHPLVEELHVTGATATHDAIVWGTGDEGARNKAAGTPKNTRRFTSELGSVSPTIVVPGPWSKADLRFQAEHIATMKLHNGGHNCVACQAMVMPRGWAGSQRLIDEMKKVVGRSTRPAWYPGAQERLDNFTANGGPVDVVDRGDSAPPLVISELSEDDPNRSAEVFGSGLSIKELDAPDPETYLRAAIDYANTELWGTLGASILIHPRTLKEIGQERFEELLAELRYGTIGVNAWSGLGFLTPNAPWGAYPGHTLDDVQSGIGTVHNAFMLENTEQVVVTAPWRPFPRGVLSGQLTLLPRPPFFITNRRQHRVGALLTDFQHKPSWLKLPRLFTNALRG